MSIAFWALSDSFSSPSGQGISTDKDADNSVTQAIKQTLETHTISNY